MNTRFQRFLSILIVTTSFLVTSHANAWFLPPPPPSEPEPEAEDTSSADEPLSGYSFSLGGSSWFFELISTDRTYTANNKTFKIPRTKLNFLKSQDKVCLTGAAVGHYTHGGTTGSAIFEFMGADDGDTTGVCYSYVRANCEPIEAAVGDGSAEKCTFTVPSLTEVNNDPYGLDWTLDELVSGRISVMEGTEDGIDCTLVPCDLKVGVDFNQDVPPFPTVFPATTTTSGVDVAEGVIFTSDSVCLKYSFETLGLNTSFASKAKADVFRTCESFGIYAAWCTNASNQEVSLNPDAPVECDTQNSEGQLPVGGIMAAVGDHLKDTALNYTCINDIDDLRLSSCEQVNLAVCGDSDGYLELPGDYTPDITNTCESESAIELIFSSSDGGGAEYLDVLSILNAGSPSSEGNNTNPPCSGGGIRSTPNSVEDNTWDFSTTTLFGECYIDGGNGSDIITGSDEANTIRGGAGVDTLNGLGGNDFLLGGDGNDTIDGGDDNDFQVGYDCFGLDSTCTVALNNGSDVDTFVPSYGNDVTDGGRGNDEHDLGGIGYGSDVVIAWGNTDNDTIVGFTPGIYDPETPNPDVDYVLNLTGNTLVAEQAKTTGKNGVKYCRMVTGGGDEFLFPDFDNSKTLCESITVLTPAQAPALAIKYHAYFLQQ